MNDPLLYSALYARATETVTLLTIGVCRRHQRRHFQFPNLLLYADRIRDSEVAYGPLALLPNSPKRISEDG